MRQFSKDDNDIDKNHSIDKAEVVFDERIVDNETLASAGEVQS